MSKPHSKLKTTADLGEIKKYNYLNHGSGVCAENPKAFIRLGNVEY